MTFAFLDLGFRNDLHGFFFVGSRLVAHAAVDMEVDEARNEHFPFDINDFVRLRERVACVDDLLDDAVFGEYGRVEFFDVGGDHMRVFNKKT